MEHFTLERKLETRLSIVLCCAARSLVDFSYEFYSNKRLKVCYLLCTYVYVNVTETIITGHKLNFSPEVCWNMHNTDVFTNKISGQESLNGTPFDGFKYIVVELNPNLFSEYRYNIDVNLWSLKKNMWLIMTAALIAHHTPNLASYSVTSSTTTWFSADQ